MIAILERCRVLHNRAITGRANRVRSGHHGDRMSSVRTLTLLLRTLRWGFLGSRSRGGGRQRCQTLKPRLDQVLCVLAPCMSRPLLHARRRVVLGDLAARLAPSFAFIEKVAKPSASGLPACPVAREFSILSNASYQPSGHCGLPFSGV